MVCPFRKEVVKTIDPEGSPITVHVNFLNCYQRACPFWNNYKGRCMRLDKGE